MRIQVHVSPQLGQALESAAKAKGITLNNEVKLRLGLSMLTRNEKPELMVEQIARTLYHVSQPGVDWEQCREAYTRQARAALSFVPPNEQPYFAHASQSA
jgi:cell division protein FtsB